MKKTVCLQYHFHPLLVICPTPCMNDSWSAYINILDKFPWNFVWLVTWRKRWKLLYIGTIILWIKHYKTAQALLSWVGNEVGEEGRGGNKALSALLLIELLVDWYKTFIWGHNEYVIGWLGSTVIRLDFLSFGRALCIQLSMLWISRKSYCAVGVFYEAIALLEKLQVFMLFVAYGRQPYFISIQQAT